MNAVIWFNVVLGAVTLFGLVVLLTVSLLEATVYKYHNAVRVSRIMSACKGLGTNEAVGIIRERNRWVSEKE